MYSEIVQLWYVINCSLKIVVLSLDKKIGLTFAHPRYTCFPRFKSWTYCFCIPYCRYYVQCCVHVLCSFLLLFVLLTVTCETKYNADISIFKVEFPSFGKFTIHFVPRVDVHSAFSSFRKVDVTRSPPSGLVYLEDLTPVRQLTGGHLTTGGQTDTLRHRNRYASKPPACNNDTLNPAESSCKNRPKPIPVSFLSEGRSITSILFCVIRFYRESDSRFVAL